MARIDASGAELGNTNELDSVTTTVGIGSFTSDSAQARSGSRSWHGSIIGATALLDAGFGTMATPGTDPTAYAVRFSFYLAPGLGITLGSASRINIFACRHGTNAEATSFTVEGAWTNNAATATITVRAGTFAAPLATLTFTGVATGAWHDLQIRATIGTGVGQTDSWAVRLDGVEQIGTAVDLTLSGLLQVDFGVLGQNDLVNLATDVNVYVDDIIVDDANAGVDTIPRPSFLVFLRPDADLATGWTANGAGATHTARVVDNSDGTSVSSVVDAQVERFGTSDIPTGFPAGTTYPAVYTSWRDSRGGGVSLPGDIVSRHETSGSNGTTTTTVVTDSSTAATRRSVHTRTVAPSGSAWTVADVNDLRLYLESDVSGVGEAVVVHELWHYAEVAVKVDATDTAAASESPVIAATVTASDTAVAGESPGIVATVTTEDTAATSESQAITAAVTTADAVSETPAGDKLVYLPGGGGTVLVTVCE